MRARPKQYTLGSLMVLIAIFAIVFAYPQVALYPILILLWIVLVSLLIAIFGTALISPFLLLELAHGWMEANAARERSRRNAAGRLGTIVDTPIGGDH